MIADVPTSTSGLECALARLEAIVCRGLRAAAGDGRIASDPFQGLHLDHHAIARLLARKPAEKDGDATKVTEDLPAAAEGSELWSLARAYDLTPFDLDVLLLALGPEIDLRYERFYAYLQDDVTCRRPTVNLALELLCTDGAEMLAARTRFAPSAPLLHYRLIEWVGESSGLQPLLACSFRLDDQIVRFLTGGSGLDPRLSPFARIAVPAFSFETCGLGDSAVALQRVVDAALAAGEPIAVAIYGPDERRRTAAAHAVAERAGRPLLLVDLSAEADFERLLPIIVREAELQDAVLMLEHWAQLRSSGSASVFRGLAAALTAHAGITILSDIPAWEAVSGGPAGVVSFECAKPQFDVSRACWSEAVAMATGAADADVAHTLACRFRLTVDQIWDAAVTARRLAAARATDGQQAAPEPADFLMAARRQSTSDFGGLATRIRPAATWGELVLPDDAVAQLREIAQRIEFGHTVLNSWGFDRRLSYGKGIVALFSGPPGTGKTMAAEVIARELGFDLYRVEIPTVVSKWIGETEKNLDRLFTGAENAILLFDEADALFGKRSEVHDAHDRYANIEVSFLLQRLEAFDGLAILSTNMRHNVDEAFLRRLSFLVQFPFPDDQQRERIWARVWPAETPRSPDLDFEWLARQFRVSGGHIKNIALAAAYGAAARGGPVEMADVLHAVRREYQKLGKQLDAADLATPTVMESLA